MLNDSSKSSLTADNRTSIPYSRPALSMVYRRLRWLAATFLILQSSVGAAPSYSNVDDLELCLATSCVLLSTSRARPSRRAEFLV